MFLVLALLAATNRRAKLIIWLQNLYPEVAMELGVRGLRGPLGSGLIRLRNMVLRRADQPQTSDRWIGNAVEHNCFFEDCCTSRCNSRQHPPEYCRRDISSSLIPVSNVLLRRLGAMGST
jgi:hypothetical protein